jgi:hypothetical protein
MAAANCGLRVGCSDFKRAGSRTASDGLVVLWCAPVQR